MFQFLLVMKFVYDNKVKVDLMFLENKEKNVNMDIFLGLKFN